MNLMIICIDSLRKDHIGYFGNEWINTPNLDRFASESVSLDGFSLNGIPTIPFRRGLMSGRRVHPYSDAIKKPEGDFTPLGWQPLSREEVTIQETLKKAGYVTAMISDCPHYFKPDMNHFRGFDSYQHIRGQELDPFRTGPAPYDVEDVLDPQMANSLMRNFLEQHIRNTIDRRSEEDFFAPLVFRTAEKWLAANAGMHEKFYLYIDCFDPHEPWDAPSEYTDLYDPGYEGRVNIFPKTGSCDHLPPEEIKHIRAMYAAEVTMVDRWFGHFMEKFYTMGLDEDTAVMVCADHGLPLGEHNIMKKSADSLYPELMDIPALIRLPGARNAGLRVPQKIQEYDVAPTMLGLLGEEVPESMMGQDFNPLLDGQELPWREVVSGGMHTYCYVRNGRYHYMRDLVGDSTPRLFDLKQDPGMEQDLYEKGSDLAAKMEKLLQEQIGGWVPNPELLKGRSWTLPYRPFNLKKK